MLNFNQNHNCFVLQKINVLKKLNWVSRTGEKALKILQTLTFHKFHISTIKNNLSENSQKVCKENTRKFFECRGCWYNIFSKGTPFTVDKTISME